MLCGAHNLPLFRLTCGAVIAMLKVHTLLIGEWLMPTDITNQANSAAANVVALLNRWAFVFVIYASVILVLGAIVSIVFLEYSGDRIDTILYSRGYYFIIIALCLVVIMFFIGMLAQIILIQQHLAAIRFRFELKDKLEERAKNREQSR